MQSYLMEEAAMASKNHAAIQFRLTVQLALACDKYEGATELSLDMLTEDRQEILKKHGLGELRELKPDLTLYRLNDFTLEEGKDKIRVQEVPLLCVEIISPTQGSLEILDKFRVYFDIGVKSCWYIEPILRLVKIYTSDMKSETFLHNMELVDPTVGINIQLNKVFY